MTESDEVSLLAGEVGKLLSDVGTVGARELQRRSQQTMKQAAILMLKLEKEIKVVESEEVMSQQEGYVVTKTEVGRGTRAVIYKGSDSSKNVIACKVTCLKDLKGVSRIRYLDSLKVLRFLLPLKHPTILGTQEIFVTPEKIFVFCPLIGLDLRHLMCRTAGGLPVPLSVMVGRQVAIGLAFLHSLGIAHERIKPQHILLDEKGTVKIGGLGWVLRFYDPVTQSILMSKGSTNTPFEPFFAPEVTKDDPYDPSLADIWSLGCLLVVMMTKNWPFQKEMNHRFDIAYQLAFRKAGVELNSHISKLLRQCFQVEPTNRGDIFDVLSNFPSLSALNQPEHQLPP